MFRFWSRVKQSTPEEALAALRGDGLLIDVRSPGEFRAGHARGAKSIPLTTLSGRASHLPGERAIHLICASGNRSRAAARMLEKAGLENVSSVRGGTAAWARAGLPVERG